MVKKIGIMGGTFNPIHFGHLLFAQQAKETLNLDEIIFIPSGNPYMKDAAHVLNGKIRLEMTALAIKGYPGFGISSIEIDKDGPSYTYETLMQLRLENPLCHYFFIVGADSLLAMGTWKHPEKIFQNCSLAAAVRGGVFEDQAKEAAADLTRRFNADIHILPSRFIDLSSSEIRERIKNRKPIRYMLPENVIEYIDTHQLYL